VGVPKPSAQARRPAPLEGVLLEAEDREAGDRQAGGLSYGTRGRGTLAAAVDLGF
jgi:hypothetical protein